MRKSLSSIIVLCVASVSLPLAVCCWGASAVPAPRLARTLSAERVAAHAARVRHNEALKNLFAETGIPQGSDASNILLRTRSLELINDAITNGVELADGGGVTADEVASAAGDFVDRYILGKTNSAVSASPNYYGVINFRPTCTASESEPLHRSSQWTATRVAFLNAHGTCAACGVRATTVHHVIPFHLAPELELDANNLIPFCDRCHFFVGHLGDWKSYNPSCRVDAAAWLERCKARPYNYSTNPAVLVIGDSHAAGRLPHSSVDSWIVPDLLDVPASNRLAVSGSTAAQWAEDQNGWLASATNNRSPVVWLSLGGNDAVAMLADGRVTPDEARAAASNYYAVVRAVARGRRLVIATAYADPYQGAHSDYALGLLMLNAAIRLQTMRACNELGVAFNVLDEPDILGPANYDGSGDLHPDAAGYTNLALRLRAIIKEQCK